MEKINDRTPLDVRFFESSSRHEDEGCSKRFHTCTRFCMYRIHDSRANFERRNSRLWRHCIIIRVNGDDHVVCHIIPSAQSRPLVVDASFFSLLISAWRCSWTSLFAKTFTSQVYGRCPDTRRQLWAAQVYGHSPHAAC